MKLKMEDMAQEFGNMLKITLDKMREKIEVSNNSIDNDSSIQMMRRLEDFNLGDDVNRKDVSGSNQVVK